MTIGMRYLKLVCVPALLLVILSNIAATGAAYGQTDESSIKAQWINDLIPYIRWTGRPHKELNICIVGRENVHVYLKGIIEKEEIEAQRKGKTLPPVHVEKQSTQADFTKCHILYVSTSEQDYVDDILKRTVGKQILTVSSLDQFANKGGIVEFVISSDGVVVRINEKPAEEAKIVIDSDLLGFAKRIYK
jgi:hypothetical protein